MKEVKKVRSRHYLILIAVCATLAISGLRFGLSNANVPSQSKVRIQNRSPKFVVQHIDIHQSSFSVVLRNDYDKTITAFSVGSATNHTRTELIGTDQTISPGAIKVKDYDFPPSGPQEYSTTIQAVIFEDGTSEGDPQIIKEFRDNRMGEKAQLSRIIPLLQRVLDAPDGKVVKLLERVRSEIANLPERQHQESFDYCAALQDTKNLVLSKIDELHQLQQHLGIDALRQGLAHTIERCATKVATL